MIISRTIIAWKWYISTSFLKLLKLEKGMFINFMYELNRVYWSRMLMYSTLEDNTDHTQGNWSSKYALNI